MKKNGILTFLFAFVPGAGQMYQGYMKRGLSLITMLCLFIMAGAMTGLDPLIVGCLIVYMYSFFDTFNLRAQIMADNAPEDDYLVHINWQDKRMQQFMMDSHKLLVRTTPSSGQFTWCWMSCRRSWPAWRWSSAASGWCAAPRAKRTAKSRSRPRTKILPSIQPQTLPSRTRTPALPCPSWRLCWVSR